MPRRGKPRMTPSAGLTQRDRGFILWADTENFISVLGHKQEACGLLPVESPP